MASIRSAAAMYLFVWLTDGLRRDMLTRYNRRPVLMVFSEQARPSEASLGGLRGRGGSRSRRGLHGASRRALRKNVRRSSVAGPSAYRNAGNQSVRIFRSRSETLRFYAKKERLYVALHMPFMAYPGGGLVPLWPPPWGSSSSPRLIFQWRGQVIPSLTVLRSTLLMVMTASWPSSGI